MDATGVASLAAGGAFLVSAARTVMGRADRNLQQRAAAVQRDERAARLQRIERLRSDAGERNHSVCERLRSSGECVGLAAGERPVLEGVVVGPQDGPTDGEVLDGLLDELIEAILTSADRERGVS